MNKETFIALMKQNEYELEEINMDNAMTDSPTKIDYTGSNAFRRGNYIIYVQDAAIEILREKDFNSFYKAHTMGYHFFDDWKKDFKGSEFLIPLVEEEIQTRLRMQMGKFITKVHMIKEGYYTTDEVIEDYQTQIKELMPEHIN